MEWEDCYRDEDTPWDLGGPAPPLMELLAERPGEIWGEGTILVPGCGRGHDAAALHRAGRDVLALDLAPSALAAATQRYGTPEGLTWLEGDYFDAELAAAHRVGAIFEHTCFCAIPPERREAYVRSAGRWLEPGGRLVAIFFLEPPGWETGGAGPPFGAEREEIRDLFAEGFEIQREAVPNLADAGREGREWVVEFIRKH